jgi:large subunit ribosomal protein L15
MKLHDLQPAEGSRKARTRVGRGIAAGKGKTAGRGTKGQKARAGGSIPPWFEGGQTPLHMRIPKLRGFKNRFKIEYEVVNIGAIGALAKAGAFELEGDVKKASNSAPLTINQDILRAVGLVRTLNKPMKVLGAGEVSTPLFVVADAFTASARAKIEAAGGSVNVLEVPKTPLAALGVTPEADAAPVVEESVADVPAKAPKASKPKAAVAPAPDTETETTTTETETTETDAAAATQPDTADADADEPTTADDAEPATGDDA